MTNLTNVTRRTFGGLLAATAVTAPTIVSAAVRQPRDETILQLNSIPLAWPQYHKIDSFAVEPRVGDDLTLVREAQHNFDEEAVAVYTSDYKRLGYISRRHNAAIAWAMQRGTVQKAKITMIAAPYVRGKVVRGWGAFRIDVEVSAPASS